MKKDILYVVCRDGNAYKYFGSRQSALNYFAACIDLCPTSTWTISMKEVS